MASIIRVDDLQDSGGNSYLSSDGSGTVTVGNSALKNTPAFSVNLTSTQSVSNSSETKVTHNNTLIDTNSGWDSSNYRYTFPTTGKYLVTHSVRFESTSAARVISWVRKNGSSSDNLNTIETNPNSSGVNPSAGGSFIYSFTANDYIEHYVFQNAGSSKNIEVGSNHLICFLQATKLIGA